MKQFTSIVAAIGISLCTILSADAASYSVTVLPGTMTNIFALGANQGPILAKQVIFVPTSGGAGQAELIDAPTNALGYSTLAYSNIVSYATNYVLTWTNYYGVVQSNNYVGGTLLTNWQLVDITNSVASATYLYSVRLYMSAAANTTVTYGPTSGNLNGFYFDQGMWATNMTSCTNQITVIY